MKSRLLSMFILLALTLVACAPAATPTSPAPAASEAPAATQAPAA